MFQKEETACLKTCLRAKSLILLRTRGTCLLGDWRRHCVQGSGHRGVKGGRRMLGIETSQSGSLVGARSHGAFKATRGAVLDSEK